MIKDNFGQEILEGSRVAFVHQPYSSGAISMMKGTVVRTKVYAIVNPDGTQGETTVKPSRLVVL